MRMPSDASRGPRSGGDFGALVGPRGVWLLEYAEEAGGLRVIQSWSDQGPYESADEAFAALRLLLDAHASRRSRLAVTLNGFGALHHTVLLPGANDDILAPLVRREVLRSFDLLDPVIRFTVGDTVDRRSSPRARTDAGPKMVFIAAIPRDTAAAMQRHLGDASVRIDCVTVVAESLRHMYASLGGSPEPTAVLVCLAGGPYLAFFLDGHPEIVIDPPVSMDGDGESAMDPELLQDQVERGEVYFRQRFGGAEPARLLLAAPPSHAAALAASLQDSTGIPVEPLLGAGATGGAQSESGPEAIVAIGGVFASRTSGAIDLFERKPAPSERLHAATRAFGTPALVAAGIAALAVLWLAFQLVMLERSTSARDSLERDVAAALASSASARSMAEERQNHAAQAATLRAIYGERARLAGTLASVARIAAENGGAAGPVRFDTLQVEQSKKGGWSVSIQGAVLGAPGSYAVRTLNDFYAALRTEPAISLASLDHFDYGRTARDSARSGPEVALTFALSFEIAPEAEADR